jgi:hypothetical protein
LGAGNPGPSLPEVNMKYVIIKRLIRKSELIKSDAKQKNNLSLVQDMEEFIALLEMLEKTND